MSGKHAIIITGIICATLVLCVGIYAVAFPGQKDSRQPRDTPPAPQVQPPAGEFIEADPLVDYGFVAAMRQAWDEGGLATASYEEQDRAMNWMIAEGVDRITDPDRRAATMNHIADTIDTWR